MIKGHIKDQVMCKSKNIFHPFFDSEYDQIAKICLSFGSNETENNNIQSMERRKNIRTLDT